MTPLTEQLSHAIAAMQAGEAHPQHYERARALIDQLRQIEAIHGEGVKTAQAIRMAAHQFAGLIEADEFAALSTGTRGDLRMLPCDMLGWADTIDPDGAQVVPPRAAEVFDLSMFRQMAKGAR